MTREKHIAFSRLLLKNGRNVVAKRGKNEKKAGKNAKPGIKKKKKTAQKPEKKSETFSFVDPCSFSASQSDVGWWVAIRNHSFLHPKAISGNCRVIAPNCNHFIPASQSDVGWWHQSPTILFLSPIVDVQGDGTHQQAFFVCLWKRCMVMALVCNHSFSAPTLK